MQRISRLAVVRPAIGLTCQRRLLSFGRKKVTEELPPVQYYLGVPQNGKLSQLKWPDRFVILLVFSLTGTSAVMIVRPILEAICEEGYFGLQTGDGFIKGPWTFRAVYFAVMWPSYTLLLILWGLCFSRYRWFARMAHKMWARILPKPMSNLMFRILIQDCPQRTSVGWTTGYRTAEEAAAAAAAKAAAAAGGAKVAATVAIPAPATAASGEVKEQSESAHDAAAKDDTAGAAKPANSEQKA